MARLDPGASARWVARRAKQAAESLKSEYEAGRRGDESPVEPIFPTPGEQLAAIQRLLTRTPRPGADDEPGADGGEPATSQAHPATTTDDPGDQPDEAAEAADIASALKRVDWQQVRAATAERTGDAAEAMRSMARQVDWGKVQPVAAQVSSALIAAVAAGRVPVGGPLGPLVAKALTDRGRLAARIGDTLRADDTELPPDFRTDLADGDHVATDAAEPAASGDVQVAPLPRWRRGRT